MYGKIEPDADKWLVPYVTRLDFKTHNIDHRRWLVREGGWLARVDQEPEEAAAVKRMCKRALDAVIRFDSWTKNFFLGGGRW